MTEKLPLAPAFNYPPVGRCVYCGTTVGRLTKEHVIARGLNGNFVLPEASCDTCSSITSDFERVVLRGFLERGRLAMGFASRHKKRVRPSSLPTTLIGVDGAAWEAEIPISDSVQVIHLPVFILPLRLGGTPKDGSPRGVEIFAVDTMHIGSPLSTMRAYAATGVQVQDYVDTWAFARMLGKIAHCFYIGEKGWFPLEESPVLPVVMGKSDLAKEWIGCLEHAPLVKPGSHALHLMDITELPGPDGSICSVVRIRLFSTSSGPTYAVVARIRASQ